MSKKKRAKWLTESEETNVDGATHVRLRLVYVDWVSTLKIAFLIGIVQAVIVIVAAAILNVVIVQTHMFDAANAVIGSVMGNNAIDVNSLMNFGQSVGFATAIGVLNLVVITVMGAIGAVLYNVIAKMTGGIKVGFSNK
jgi:hypothetical protein